jgi:propionyl-CoA carboxylase alpha chain
MRIVQQPADFDEALASCQREAKNSFGDDAVLIEKYVQRPRHIEIQVFGDTHGNLIHLHERDCSVQRRHQKVLEESPAPGLSADMRELMGAAAVAAAKAVNYVGAGTVEFIVEQSERGMDFFFMEMNTRLQVEHPVTEAVTGLDLVEWQLRIASGEPLPLTQAQVKVHGHSIEARICAETPDNDFLPAIGRLHVMRTPTASRFSVSAFRFDSGVREGDSISPYYDSMIAKLIVHGRDRNEAIAKMREALNAFVIRGISSNIPFQSALLAHPDFVSGNFNTGFIAENYGKGFHAEDVPHNDSDFLIALAAFVRRKSRERTAGLSGQLPGYDVKVGQNYTVITLKADGKNESRSSSRYLMASQIDIKPVQNNQSKLNLKDKSEKKSKTTLKSQNVLIVREIF